MNDQPNLADGKAMASSYLIETRKDLPKFRARLLNWFDEDHRRLPWRTSKPVPYRVWVSEIMLQQTRVAVVVDYYRRFLRQFPTVRRLAAADEQEVLAAWSGLGYYRRARMMHQAAKTIVSERKGKFPDDSADLRTLPGIGRYTAAAIASICFDENVAVVDGNVERVVGRLLGQSAEGDKVDLWSVAQQLLPAKRPGDFNQAMMELGATICLPRNPECHKCPVEVWCKTRGESRVLKIAKRRSVALNYLVSLKVSKVALVQRPRTSPRMAGMWELPEVNSGPRQEELLSLRHCITNTDYRVKVFAGGDTSNCVWIPLRKLQQTALTGVTRKILRRMGLMNIKRATVSRPTRPDLRRKKINAGT